MSGDWIERWDPIKFSAPFGKLCLFYDPDQHPDDRVFVADAGCSSYWTETKRRRGRSYTHWMPLPKPPENNAC